MHTLKEMSTYAYCMDLLLNIHSRFTLSNYARIMCGVGVLLPSHLPPSAIRSRLMLCRKHCTILGPLTTHSTDWYNTSNSSFTGGSGIGSTVKGSTVNHCTAQLANLQEHTTGTYAGTQAARNTCTIKTCTGRLKERHVCKQEK